jgi:hypothetical protein
LGDSIALRKVKVGNYNDFAKETIFALENYDKLSEDAKRTSKR